MKEEINEKTQYRLMLTVLAIVIVLLLFLVWLLIRHGKQVNPDTIEVKPQQLIMGTELEEIEIVFGPKMSEAEKILAIALIKEYCPQAVYTESVLKIR